ncbi:MAG: RnfH family protein [Pseudomonadota bacterium]
MTIIRVEVVFALPERQVIVALELPAGATLYEAVLRSGLAAQFPGQIDPETTPAGVFGKLEKQPRQRVLADGDRVEIYRPLTIDPKDARRARARRRSGG